MARDRMRIILSRCDVVTIKNLLSSSCDKVNSGGPAAIRHIHVKIDLFENRVFVTFW